jgi:predicted transcriptional regulator
MKSLSLKLDEEIFTDMENILEQKDQSRNRYINEAVQWFNQMNRRRILTNQLACESRMVAADSMAVLSEFENLEDED